MTERRIIRPTIAIVVVAGALFTLDGILARTEMREMRSEAAESFHEGTDLLTHGKPAQAVTPLRKAWVLERENPVYTLQLGEALTRLGQLTEAEPLITDALNRRPNDGEANLAAARLMIRKNSPQEAIAFFHRAIYGEWLDNAPAKRIAARLEIIQFLAERKRRQEMLGELISLDAETAGQTPVRKKLAHFYMLAGSPARAATVYRELEQQEPGDLELLTGLGEAELQSGQYRAARSAFLRAAMHNPGAPIQSRLQLVDTLTALDPTPRQLTSTEKYRRSLKLLDVVSSDLDQLLQANPEQATDETGALLKRAADTLAKPVPAHVNNEMAEDVLTFVEDLWAVRLRLFGTDVSQEEEAASLLLDRLKS